MCRVDENPSFTKIAVRRNVVDRTRANARVPVLTQATRFGEDRPRTMDLEDIKSESDLAALKKEDPFMFYSIPSVQKKVMEGKRSELSSTYKAIAKESTVVKRSRRIAFESIDNGMAELFALQDAHSPSFHQEIQAEEEQDHDESSDYKDSFDYDAFLEAFIYVKSA